MRLGIPRVQFQHIPQPRRPVVGRIVFQQRLANLQPRGNVLGIFLRLVHQVAGPAQCRLGPSHEFQVFAGLVAASRLLQRRRVQKPQPILLGPLPDQRLQPIDGRGGLLIFQLDLGHHHPGGIPLGIFLQHLQQLLAGRRDIALFEQAVPQCRGHVGVVRVAPQQLPHMPFGFLVLFLVDQRLGQIAANVVPSRCQFEGPAKGVDRLFVAPRVRLVQPQAEIRLGIAGIILLPDFRQTQTLGEVVIREEPADVGLADLGSISLGKLGQQPGEVRSGILHPPVLREQQQFLQLDSPGLITQHAGPRQPLLQFFELTQVTVSSRQQKRGFALGGIEQLGPLQRRESLRIVAILERLAGGREGARQTNLRPGPDPGPHCGQGRQQQADLQST